MAGQPVYTKIFNKEVREFLKENTAKSNLIIATSILDSFGDLAAIATSLSEQLQPSGILAFVNQREVLADYILDVKNDTFVHSINYIKSVFGSKGFSVLECKEVTLPGDKEGDIFILKLQTQ
jgi:predicted TPR repeat methyltransferase